jgi:predicted small metal-binding protein
MKRFRCGDVIPDCPAEFVGTEEQILRELADHTRTEHGLPELPPELVEAVRAKARPV